MNSLIQQLKDTDQDFEFYPTTQEIIARLIADLREAKEERYLDYRDLSSVLDIGAGSGKVLKALRDQAGFTALYAIEKSPLLCQCLDEDIFIVGTDFHEQSLVAKQVELTFCNPPYSEFEEWTVKIIRESASRLVYLVIPERWQRSTKIADALPYREAKIKIAGHFDFTEAEDRMARAKVHLLRVELSTEKDDAFDRFFNAEFAELRAKFDTERRRDGPEKGARRNPKLDALIVGVNYPDMLVGLYNEELEHIRKNYALVKALDVDLLREFDVSPERIMGCLKARLTGLRILYWQELFSHMKSVTNRLTSKKRRVILETLNKQGHVDFTVSNIHAILLWVLKNANSCLNAQLLETFDHLVGTANVRNYRSNQRVFVHDRWRYSEEKPTHIALEYRLVLAHMGGVRKRYEWERGLAETAAEFLGDLLTVAHGLGFCGDTADPRLTRSGRKDWEANQLQGFTCAINGAEEVLFEVRGFLNGNILRADSLLSDVILRKPSPR